MFYTHMLYGGSGWTSSGGFSFSVDDALALYVREGNAPPLVSDFVLQVYGINSAAKSLTDVVPNFTRASVGTRVNASKLLVTAAVDEIRIDHDPVTGASRGMLIEPAATNVAQAGHDMTLQTAVRCTPTSGQGTGPFGPNDLCEIVVDNLGGNTNAYIKSPAQLTFSSVSATTVSVFARKSSTLDWVRLGTAALSVSPMAYFDLTNGVVGTVSGTGTPTASIEDWGGGLYRCSLTFQADVADVLGSVMLYPASSDGSVSVAADGVSSIYCNYIQVETGATPTSYILTAGAAATRAKDIASIPTSAFNYADGAAGTWIVEYSTVNNSVDGYILDVHDGVGGTKDSVYHMGASNRPRVLIRNAFNWEAILYGAVGDPNIEKLAVAINTNDLSVVFSGQAVQTDTTVNLATGHTAVNYGASYNGGLQLGGHIRSMVYHDARLSNAELAIAGVV